ncbi:cupin domain-containing protein [Colletotrichum truncatum]|uniref:Cupin domain-containing protein n=1 Tax=Colletotrichum truncatum TaxID=5467 RepID=A0ACC3ZDZ8_COLTU
MWPDVEVERAGEKLKSGAAVAATEYDVIPVPEHKLVEPQPWNDTDTILPGTQDPYFLRNGTGPSAVLGGTVIRRYVTAAESGSTFSLGTIEGSQAYETQVLSGGIQFPTVDHCLYVTDGYMEIKVNDSNPSRVGPAEVVWLPAGTNFDIRVVSQYTKVFAYSQPGGLVDLLFEAGKGNPHAGRNSMIPSVPVPFERNNLLKLQDQFEFNFSS